MTLNLMLTSPTGVYLSGDFRLTSSSGPLPDNLNTQKLVPVVKLGWFALVSFAGVGRTAGGLDVGEWLAAETAAIAPDARVGELEHRLLNAYSWLAATCPNRRHIFSAVGFNGPIPFAMIVTNYLDDQGQPLPAIGNMQSHVVSTDQPLVFVGRWSPAVLPDEIEGLRQALTDGTPPMEIQQRMAAVNAAGAVRSATISPQCVTGHLLANGHGEVAPRGISDTSEYMPSFVRRQLQAVGIRGYICATDGSGKPLAPYWVGMTLQIQSDLFAAVHAIRNITPPPCTAIDTSPVFWENTV